MGLERAASFVTAFCEESSGEGASEATGGVSTDAASGAGVSDAGVRRVLGMIILISVRENGASTLTLIPLYWIPAFLSKAALFRTTCQGLWLADVQNPWYSRGRPEKPNE